MKNIVIVGVGALGSHLAPLLRNLEEARLTVIDFDRVERKNVLSQFHPRQSVGRSKVQALQQTLQFLFGLRVEAVPHRLTGDNVKALLGGADLVVDCLDHGPSRRCIQRFVRAQGIPCVHGALAAGGAFGRIVWDEAFVVDDGVAGAATCEDGEHLPFIGICAAFLAHSVQRFVRTGERVGAAVHPAGAEAL